MDKLKAFFKSNQTLLLVTLFFSVTVFLFAPLELYIMNVQDFWFSIGDLLPGTLLTMLCVLVASVLIGKLLRGAGSYWTALLLALGLLFYLQGNFLNGQMGLMDGKAVNWDETRTQAIINIAIWAVIVIASLVLASKKKLFEQIAGIGAVVLTLIQLIAIVMILFMNVGKFDKPAHTILDEDLLTLSTEENVIVLMLDAYDAETFETLIEEEPEYRSIYDGFTYLHDFSMSYPTTKGALPYILTREPYENDVPYSDYIEAAFNSTTFYQGLNEKNYDVRVYTSSSYIPASQKDLIANIEEARPYPNSRINLQLKMIKSSLYRGAPQLLKQAFWFYSGEFDDLMTVGMDSEPYRLMTANEFFYDKLKNEGITLAEQKAYRFYHLFGIHSPYTLDAEFNVVDSSTKIDQAHALMLLQRDFIERLKELNIYDQSTIIITADHGTGKIPSRPLFLIKEKDARGALKTDETPASHADLYAMIYSAIGGDDRYGASILDEDATPSNEGRRLLLYQWADEWNKDYLPVMTEYDVLPGAWDEKSYQPTGNTYEPK